MFIVGKRLKEKKMVPSEQNLVFLPTFIYLTLSPTQFATISITCWIRPILKSQKSYLTDKTFNQNVDNLYLLFKYLSSFTIYIRNSALQQIG